jgi:glycosyltransferase involved in cell wall biosynthesis
MACGCPTAVADAGSLREVCGDATRYFDPTSAEAIAEAVEDVLDDSAHWAEQGIRRAASFTWERCAQEHEAVYRELRGP